MQELQAINEKAKELRMELVEKAIKTLKVTKNVTNNYRIQEAIETVLQALDNSISKEEYMVLE